MVDRKSEATRPLLLKQQSTLAAFAHEALVSDDVDALLQRACELLVSCLSGEVGKVLELTEDRRHLSVRAAVGLKPEMVTWLTGTGIASAAGYALETAQPVVSNDLENEDRFGLSDIVRELNIASMANVPIHLPDRTPFGVLEVDRKRSDPFTDDDVAFLTIAASLLGAAIERHRKNQEILATAEERETLLRELEHRVKNNMQVISSLIAIHAGNAASEETRRELRVLLGRIDTLRLLHERLYRSQHVNRIELRGYLSEIGGNLIDFHGEEAGDIQLTTKLDRMVVTVDLAVPLGLIVNEFITNSVKHAFTGSANQQGVITMELTRAGKEGGVLTLRDNGKGLTSSPSTQQSSGLRLIELLAQQIRAEIAWSGEGGTRLRVKFPRLP